MVPLRTRLSLLAALGLFELLLIGELCAEKRPSKAESFQADSIYEELKTEYLRLRNTDVDITQTPRWKELIQRIDEFIARYPAHPKAPFAWFKNAVLYEQLYRRFGEEDNLRRSCSYLEELARRFPKDDLADDALVRKADFLLYDLHEIEQAKDIYHEVWTQYPESDMREVARARLRSLESGEYAAYLSGRKAERTPVPRREGKEFLVMIDPGHGGDDVGARGQGGLLEKDVVLALAFELERLLKEKPGIAVRLTRTKDVFVPLAERIQLANDYEADLFISLHTNASPQGKLSGLETYYLDNRGDEASRLLVERENSSIKFEPGQGDLQYMLGDLIQNAKLEESIVLANFLQRSLINTLRGRWDFVKDLGVRKAPFYVLVGAHMPCVLVELFFIDHPIDGQRLAAKEFRRDMAQGLIKGIEDFLHRRMGAKRS